MQGHHRNLEPSRFQIDGERHALSHGTRHIPEHHVYFGKPSERSVGLLPLSREGVAYGLFERRPAGVSRRLVEGQYLPCRRGAAMPPETRGFRPFE